VIQNFSCHGIFSQKQVVLVTSQDQHNGQQHTCNSQNEPKCVVDDDESWKQHDSTQQPLPFFSPLRKEKFVGHVFFL
jgi:hypothetical protein